MTTFYDNMLAYRLPWKGKGAIADVAANICESYTYNKAGTEFTFKLRKGLRWSDGAPFTADDVTFAVNDLQVNKVLHPHPQARMSGRDGSGCRAVKLGTYSVKLVYPTPNSIALQGACSAGGFYLHAPAHYLKQFHIDYNPNANDVAKQAGLTDWVALINAKSDPFNLDRPTMAAWKFATPYGQGSQTVMDRNPYYGKVDPQGRQLPYIDRWVFTVSASPEVALGQVLNGQVDLAGRVINTPANKPVLAESRSKGKYDFFQLDTSFMNQGLIMLNQTAQDPVLRQIFRNKDFRIGLSYAINRPELVQTVFAGQGEPWQQAPKKDSPWYDEKMAKQYTQFSLQQANQSLDKAGYALKGGSRTGPDGKPISFVVQCANNTPQMAAMLTLIQKTWQQVGIDMSIANITEDLYFQREAANQHEASMFGASGGDNPILYAGSYIPLDDPRQRLGRALGPLEGVRRHEGRGAAAVDQGRLRPLQRAARDDEAHPAAQPDGPHPAQRARQLPEHRNRLGARRLRHPVEPAAQRAEVRPREPHVPERRPDASGAVLPGLAPSGRNEQASAPVAPRAGADAQLAVHARVRG